MKSKSSLSEHLDYTVIIKQDDNSGAVLLGDISIITNPKALKNHNIQTIITAGSEFHGLEVPPKITHITYPINQYEAETIYYFFGQAYKTIEIKLKEGGVLLQCSCDLIRVGSLFYVVCSPDCQLSHAEGQNQPTCCINPKINISPSIENQLKLYQSALRKQNDKNMTKSECKTIPNKNTQENSVSPKRTKRANTSCRYVSITLKTSEKNKIHDHGEKVY